MKDKISLGIKHFFDNVKAQRDHSIKAAAQVDENGNRPPEFRLGLISSNGRARLEFTNEMSFPSMEEFIRLNDEFDKNLVNLMMLNGDEEYSVDENL